MTDTQNHMTPRHLRAKVASLSRSRTANDPELVAARRELAEANLAAVIEKTLRAAPPLTDEQRTRLSVLFGIEAPAGPPVRSAWQIEQDRKRAFAAEAVAVSKRAFDSLTSCKFCNVPQAFHRDTSFHHEWEPNDELVARVEAEGSTA